MCKIKINLKYQHKETPAPYSNCFNCEKTLKKCLIIRPFDEYDAEYRCDYGKDIFCNFSMKLYVRAKVRSQQMIDGEWSFCTKSCAKQYFEKRTGLATGKFVS